MSSPRAILIVLDGFGIGKNSPFNAIANARKPFFNELLAKYPHSQLLTHGEAVGLPSGVMGNSEVGHMTMGAGRIIYQDLTRISKEISTGGFFLNPVLQRTVREGARGSGRVHFFGLLSDGGVHSHISHLEALLTLAIDEKTPEVFVHAFLDGRDTAPDSAPAYLRRLLSHPIFSSGSPTKATLASVSGRFYAMDRDNRWERVEQAYNVMTGEATSLARGPGETAEAQVLRLIEASYAAGKSDEFVEPTLLNPDGAIRTGDSAMFFNYRSDRARELTAALTAQDFEGFTRKQFPRLSAFAGMTQYDSKLAVPIAYGPQNMNHLFGEWLEMRSMKQFRIAETEKYAHVTFFFNGGRESPYLGEDRVLIPSPKDVATYDLKPEMSAFEVAAEAKRRIETQMYDFMLMNFANADMVGHSGNYEATVRAIEALDQCLATVVGAAEKNGAHVLITADHGNAEEMCDHRGGIHTQHTLNPVPAIWVEPGSASAPKAARQALRDGSLADLMPTLCEVLQLPLPAEVTGQSLIAKK